MSQAEKLLNSLSDEIPVHTHPVPDTDTYFIIDPITRQIENTNRKKTVVMQYDHNSERFTFELPRYIDGHDMMECTSVTVNVDNIEVVESDGVEVVGPRVNSDAPDMTDLRVHPNDPEKVICSWCISRNSTQLAGILSFHIEFKCADSSGNVVYEWSTDNFDKIEVRTRKKNGEAAVVEHTDLLEQWRTRIFGAGDSVMANIAAEGEAQVAVVQEAAGDLLEVAKSKGDAIACEAFGESIAIEDSSDDYLRGLRVFGKSIQDGTPTPDNPVEIASIANPTVTVGTQEFAVNRVLSGIPVTSGGNYTDSDGQQWICDEIDLERGVYVQRVGTHVIDENASVYSDRKTDGSNSFPYRYYSWGTNRSLTHTEALCDRLSVLPTIKVTGNDVKNMGISCPTNYGCFYFNINQYMTEDTNEACKAALADIPITIKYVLKTPIETPLTAEEITAFKALRTNYPNTTILNDAGAWMSVKYNADTKTYVENPKTLKLVDSSTGVVYELKIVDGNLTVNPV